MAQVFMTGFVTTLAQPLLAEDTSLAVNAAAQAMLLARLGEDGYAFLHVGDQTGAEVIKVSAFGQTLVAERGQGDTVAKSFPKGACVDARVTYAGVKDMVCNYDCCADGCPCEAVEAAGAAVPVAHPGTPWEGMVVFTGELPMALSVEGAPAWLGVTLGPNFVKLAGTPPVAGTYVLSVAAANCVGRTASQPVVLNVQT